MIIKAFIKSLPTRGDNVFKVRVPFLEDNTDKEMIFDALLCSPPGEYNGYSVGDCVFISFENDKLDTPIILGKLFVDVDDNSSTYKVLNELKVLNKVDLPASFSIGGYSIGDFFQFAQVGPTAILENSGSSSGGGGGSSNLDYIVIGEWH